jgi:hypothetical protein
MDVTNGSRHVSEPVPDTHGIKDTAGGQGQGKAAIIITRLPPLLRRIPFKNGNPHITPGETAGQTGACRSTPYDGYVIVMFHVIATSVVN